MIYNTNQYNLVRNLNENERIMIRNQVVLANNSCKEMIVCTTVEKENKGEMSC
jgi:hypothetical protein